MCRKSSALVAAVLLLLAIPLTQAAATVVISELLWSGTDLSTADEWIELANTSSGAVDLSGFALTKLSSGSETGMLVLPAESTIGSGGFFLISNFDEAHSRLGIRPDIVSTGVGLSNTQLLIRLYDAAGSLIDAVDDGVGAPFAGSNGDPKASMERILNQSEFGSGQVKESWATATTFLNFDDGARLFGTPGALNGTGPSVDTFPPKEATSFAAEFKKETGGAASGELIVSWVPSVSLDLSSQLLSYDPPIADGTGMVLLASATGVTFAEGFLSGTGTLFTLRSQDDKGNLSNGVSTVSRLFPKVNITEVLANPAGADDNEWIELGNLGSEPEDIAGWILDEGNSPGHYVISPSSGTKALLQPQEHVSFRKSETHLPLDNRGEELSLKRGLQVMDTWAYPETAEEVSYGLSPEALAKGERTFQAFCVPTEGTPNAVIPSDPKIMLQSGETTGTEKVTINLTAEVATGSLAHAHCSWNFGDGFVSASCNPPSHTFNVPGTYTVALTYTNFCAEQLERTLPITVLAAPPPPPPPPPSSGGGQNSAGGTTAGNRTSCVPSLFEGIRLSEMLPNPVGDDAAGEWIELENTTDGTVSLCGWEIDDAEGGSVPHLLDTYTMPPQGFLLLPRTQTHIAINNSAEHIRLFAPGKKLVEDVPLEESTEGQSYAIRSDGIFVWTPFLTPGAENRFREAGQRSSSPATIIISAVLPNPDGKDEGREWIELRSIGEEPLDLSGWQLDDDDGGSKPYRIQGITLRPQQAHRFFSKETGLELGNTFDRARLLDPDGNIVSVLSWHDAVSGQAYRQFLFGNGAQAVVTAVIDGDTIDVVTNGVRERVRLIGVDTPETVHPFKPIERFGKEASAFTRTMLAGQTVTLQFDQEKRDKYGRLLAYVILPDGTNFNGELVRRGFARAYLRFPFALADLFAAYEKDARLSKWGMWADAEIAGFIAEEEQRPVQIVSSGAIVPIVLATDTGAYELLEKHYALQVTFSEVMSNPPKEGSLQKIGEYLELFNGSEAAADLGGWILDDAPNASSKPYTIPTSTILSVQEYRVFPSSESHVSLNNTGEELSLTSPDGTISTRMTYPKMKQGEAYALSKGWLASRSSPQASEGWCLTSIPTPGETNICRTATIVRSSTKKPKAHGKEGQQGTDARPVDRMARTADPLHLLRTHYRSVFTESEPQLCHPEPCRGTEPNLPPLLASLQSQMASPALPPQQNITGAAKTRVIVNVLAATLCLLTLAGMACIRTLEERCEKDGSLALPVLQ